MDWLIAFVTILGMFIANGALILPLFLWNRSESRTDVRNMDTKLEAIREETRSKIDAMREESKSIQQSIRDEMKDFHARLCVLEERYLQIISHNMKKDP